jgi:alpha-glucosidase
MFGSFINYNQEGSQITLQDTYGKLILTCVTDSILNIFSPDYTDDHRSKAIEDDKRVACDVTVTEHEDHLEITTLSMSARVYSRDQIELYDVTGQLLCADYQGERRPLQYLSERDIALAESEGHEVRQRPARLPVQSAKLLDPGDQFYGLGDKTGVLNKRSYEYENWNSDLPDPQEDNFVSLYKSIPFFIVLKGDTKNASCYGIFFDNTFHSYFDFGKESQEYYYFGSENGNLNYYFFTGKSMADIVSQYTWLTGKMQLPQLWTLGYHQSRWGYDTEEKFREIAKKLREHRIPCDSIHFDIDYMDQFKVFTWNTSFFQDEMKLLSDLRDQGFKPVTIIDPGVKVESGYHIYEEGLEEDYFVKTPEGEVYVNTVWPGDSVFPDFGKPAVRNWWANKQKYLIDLGVAGVWNDMNEPASFNGPLPDDIVFTDENRTTNHAEMHNVYGHNMARATYEGWRKHSNTRPFVITRACYAGSQKYTIAWTGDNHSIWTHLRMAVPQLCNLGLSGMSYAGTDVGGFGSDVTPELMARWVQLGCFSPFFRSHCAKFSANQEPWLMPPTVLDIFRKYVELRYQLLPYIYDAARECAITGQPMMAPLVLYWQKDANVRELNDEFMLGQNLLIAPVVEQGQTKRMVYLPAGTWYNYWTGEKYEYENGDGAGDGAGRYIIVNAPLDTCPIFVRGGTILPKYPLQQYVGEIAPADLKLRLEIYPDKNNNAEYTHYRDNGTDFAYEQGEYNLYTFKTNNHVNCNHGSGSHNQIGSELIIDKLHEGYIDYAEIIIEKVL